MYCKFLNSLAYDHFLSRLEITDVVHNLFLMLGEDFINDSFNASLLLRLLFTLSWRFLAGVLLLRHFGFGIFTVGHNDNENFGNGISCAPLIFISSCL